MPLKSKNNSSNNSGNNLSCKSLKYFAIFSIYLILSLTFFAANAMATLNYVVSGNSGVDGFRSSDDNVKISTVSDYNISLINDNGERIPLDCDFSSHPIKCSYELDYGPSNLNDVNFKLVQDPPGTPSQRIARLVVDSIPPTFDFNVTKVNDQLIINYHGYDYAYDDTDNSLCSGFKSIIAFVDNNPYIQIINGSVNDCEITGSLAINLSGTPKSDLSIFLQAEDNVGNQYTSDETILTADFQSPIIDDDFEIISAGASVGTSGGNLNSVSITGYSGSTDMPINIIVHVEKNDLSAVYGNLASINTNPSLTPIYQNVKATCTKDSGNTTLNTCTFSNLLLKTTNANIQLDIRAVDGSGNIAEKVISKNFAVVSDPGNSLYIGPDKKHCLDGTCYTTSGINVFYLELGSGSNYSMSNVLLSFNDDRVPAFCYFNETWMCKTFYNVPLSVPNVNAQVLYPSSDNYGNSIKPISNIIQVDDQVPINTSGITSSMECPTSLDTLSLKFSASEDSPGLNVYANTSQFTTDDTQYGACIQGTDNNWDCTINIKDFYTSYSKNLGYVQIEDVAGNVYNMPYTFEVCEAKNNAVPKLISKVEQSTDLTIDRHTASLIPVKIYAPLKVTKSPNAIITNWDVDSCSARDSATGTEFTSGNNYFVTQGDAEGNNPTLAFYLGYQNAALPDGSLAVNCTLSARIRYGNMIYTKPEVETVSFTVYTENNPIGAIDSGAVQRISDTKQELRDLDNSMKIYKFIDNTLGALCDLANIIVKINGAIQTVKAAIYALCLGLSWLGIGVEIWHTIAHPLNGIDRLVQNYIWPTGTLSGLTSPVGLFVKYGCMLYTCQFYKVSGAYSMYHMTFDEGGLADRLKGDPEVNTLNNFKLNPDLQNYALAKDKNGKFISDSEGHPLFFNSNDQKYYTLDSLSGKYILSTYQQGLGLSDAGSTGIGKSNNGNNAAGSAGSSTVEVTYSNTADGKEWVLGTAPSNTYQSMGTFSGQYGSDGNLYYVDPTTANSAQFKIYADPIFSTYHVYQVDANGEKEVTNLQFTKDDINNMQNDKSIPQTQSYIYPLQNPAPRIVSGTDASQSGFDFTKPILVATTAQPSRENTLEPATFIGNANEFGSESMNLYRNSDGSYFTKVYDVRTRTDSNSPVVIISKSEASQLQSTSYYWGLGRFTPAAPTGHVVDVPTGYDTQTVSGKTLPNADKSVAYNIYNGNGINPSTYMSTASDRVINRNMQFYNDLESNDWVINPYRSVYYDSLCVPAIVYNKEKEKQIKCMYLTCLEQNSARGIPTLSCDKQYSYDSCLYIESAQHKLNPTGVSILRGFLKSALSFFVGYEIEAQFANLCSLYTSGLSGDSITKTDAGGGVVATGVPGSPGPVLGVGDDIATGQVSVVCGITGTVLRLNEIKSLLSSDGWSSIFKSDKPQDPATIHDYCAGVDYSG